MRKRSTTIEWRIAENDREWAQWAQTSRPTGSSLRCLPRWLGEGLLLILVLGGIGSWQWYTGQAELQPIKTELTMAVQDVSLWGAPRQLETAFFRWHYQEHDAQVVAAVAP